MPSNGRQIGEQRKLASERLNYIDGLINVASNLSEKYTQKASVGSSFEATRISITSCWIFFVCLMRQKRSSYKSTWIYFQGIII